MNIQNVPDELLYQMCQGWDDRTLLNMSQAYSRVYQVCDTEIDKRKLIRDQIDILSQEILKTLNMPKLAYMHFIKNMEDGTRVIINLLHLRFNPGSFNIIQRSEPEDIILSIPWILPEVNFSVYKNITKNAAINFQDIVMIKQLAKNLIIQGYHIPYEKEIETKEIIPESIVKVFRQRLIQIQRDFEHLEEEGFLPNKCRNLLNTAIDYFRQFEQNPTRELENLIDHILQDLEDECSSSFLYERQRLGLLRGKLKEYPIKENI